MRSVVYTQHGGPEVLTVVQRTRPAAAPGEVVVQVHRCGVNPTDWKSRSGSGAVAGGPQVPGQDGSGLIEAVGEGVDPARVGQRVWLWEAAWQRREGTAQEYVALPARQAVELPAGASLDLGAGLGIPAMTAHRCLTVGDAGPAELGVGALAGRTVLVSGGAGAVGNAAIQLARWSGARVLSTVSDAAKAQAAIAAGAHACVIYRQDDAARRLRELAPQGVDIVVDVAVAANADLDVDVLATGGVVAAYATDGGAQVSLPVRGLMTLNARLQFVLVYTMPTAAKDRAVVAISAAVAAGALRIGPDAGLPLHRFALQDAAAAHAAVEAGAVGKVLIEVVQ